MYAYQAYRHHRHSGMTRIDTVLGLYDEALNRLEQAEQALHADDAARAQVLLVHVQLAVSSLAAGMVGDASDLCVNFLRLYEFVLHHVGEKTVDSVRIAREILLTLREAFQLVRSQALQLEQEGKLPPVGTDHALHVEA